MTSHHNARTTAKPRGVAWLAILALTVTALAGCLAVDTGDTQSPDPGPTATMEADRSERWDAELFTLDARGSNAEGLEAIEWYFAMGDGTTYEGDNLSQAQIQHEYAHGGVYEVTFTLTDTDSAGENHTATDTKILTVNERHPIREQTLYAAPINETPTAHSSHGFDVHENATQWEADVFLDSVALFEESEVTIRVTDADNETLHEQNVTVQADENETVRLFGETTGPGVYHLEILVDSGGVETSGQLRVYYAPPVGDEA